MKAAWMVGMATAAALAGCAAPAQYGDFAAAPEFAQMAAADSGARFLGMHFAPAQTRFVVASEHAGHFGHELEGRLRAAGFAVEDREVGSAPAGGAGDLRYVLTSAPGLLRLSLTTNGVTASRAFDAQSGAPQGPWSQSGSLPIVPVTAVTRAPATFAAERARLATGAPKSTAVASAKRLTVKQVGGASPVAPPAKAVAVASPRKPPVPAPKPLVLISGTSLEQQINEWAKRSGWTLVWNLQQDWIVPSGATFAGGFAKAAAGVIDALAKNGVDVRADVYRANRTFVVHLAGAGQ